MLADDVLRQGVQGISDIITIPGLVNVDFADVRTVMKDSGTAMLGVGVASGKNRAEEAARAVMSAPSWNTPSTGRPVSCSTSPRGPDMTLLEVNTVSEVVTSLADPSERHLRFRRRRKSTRAKSPPSSRPASNPRDREDDSANKPLSALRLNREDARVIECRRRESPDFLGTEAEANADLAVSCDDRYVYDENFYHKCNSLT